MRTSVLKIAVSAVALAFVFGCGCGETGGLDTPKGVLSVAYPSPTDTQTEISSEASENKAVYDLGSVFMGQSATIPIKIQNNGRGQLSLASMEVIEGADIVSVGEIVKLQNPVFDVAFAADTPVEVGSEHAVNVTFKPEQLDVPSKEYLVILRLTATNVSDSTASVEITLKGKGISGRCEIPPVIDFGAVAKGDTAMEIITIKNPAAAIEATAFVGDVFGSDAPGFVYANDSARGTISLPPETSRDVKINFTPTEVREYFAFAKMRAAEQCPEVTVKVQGRGVDSVLTWYWVKPDGTRDVQRVDFGYASPGLEVRREVTFENAGKAAVNISQLKFSTNEFKVVGEDGAADPTKLVVLGAANGVSAIKALPVLVKPSLLGPRKSMLSWTTDLPKQPSGSFEGKAFGGGPDIKVSPANTLAFGRVAYYPNASPPTFTKRRITVSNVGTAPVPADNAGNLHVTPTIGIVPLPGTTDISEITATLVGQDPVKGLVAKLGENTAFVEVTITPTSYGQKSWELTIESNDPDEAAVKVIVSADVQVIPPCTLNVSPGSLNFGLVSPPAYRDLTVNIKNIGADVCLINNLNIQVGSDPTFELPGGPIDSHELVAGDTLPVVVRAFPKSTVSSTLQTVTGTLEFFYNSPSNPHYEVPLTAGIATGCLTIAPPDVDFGTVQRGCSSSERTVTVYNSCSTSVTINSISVLEGAGYPNGQGGCTQTGGCPEFKLMSVNPTVPAGGLVMPAGGSPLTFRAKYIPFDLGADQGTIALQVNQSSGAAVTYIVTLAGRGDTIGQNTDVFSQDAKPKADILIAIDSSCSMGSYQASLAANFGSFIQYAQAAGVDYHMAVITTDDEGPPHSGRFVFGTGHPEKILTPSTPDVENKFKAKVSVGTSGATLAETCLAPLAKALTAPLVNNENAGFLRPDAKLALVCVTDAPDQSSQTAIYYLSTFQSVKGSNAANALTFNAIAGFNPTPPSGCYYDSGADNGKYAYLVANTNGVKDEICTPNWSTTLEQLGKTAFGFRTDFFLNSTPDLTGGKVIEVKIDGATIPSTDSRGATVWSYDSVANSVNFEPQYVPEPGQTMTITYFVTCFAP